MMIAKCINDAGCGYLDDGRPEIVKGGIYFVERFADSNFCCKLNGIDFYYGKNRFVLSEIDITDDLAIANLVAELALQEICE